LDIAVWSAYDLRAVLADILALRHLAARGFSRSQSGHRTISYEGQPVTESLLQESLGLTDEEAHGWDVNRILKRGALLHTDIAMLVAQGAVRPRGSSSSRAARSFMALDGRVIGSDIVLFDWEFSRNLLGGVLPDPDRDQVVRLWYVAASSYMLTSGDLAAAEPQLELARSIFPRDADILFQRGYFHEMYASAAVQKVIRNPKLNFGSYASEAERLFREAVRVNPKLAEARVHLGRMQVLRGQYAQAASQLEEAMATISDRQLRYYAHLFRAQAELGLGRLAAASAHYQHAATLYPLARAPLLGIGQLARRSGDRHTAQTAVGQLLSLPASEDSSAEPWWTYYRWQARGADQVFTEIRTSFKELPSR
jgi:hypothetical protein